MILLLGSAFSEAETSIQGVVHFSTHAEFSESLLNHDWRFSAIYVDEAQIPTDQSLQFIASLFNALDPKVNGFMQVFNSVVPGRTSKLFHAAGLDCVTVHEGSTFGHSGDAVTGVRLGKPSRKKIVAAISVPRYGSILAQTTAYSALMGVGCEHDVTLLFNQGVWWHHGLSRMISKALEDESVDYILTLDFDSMFTTADVLKMVSTMNYRVDLDVLFPVQMRRGRNGVLYGGENGDFRQSVVLATSGHFGLTLFRPGIIRNMSKPWFQESPDANGDWEDGRTDADIGFWMKLREAGGHVGMISQVEIGHLEEVVSVPFVIDGELQSRYLTTQEWAGIAEWKNAPGGAK